MIDASCKKNNDGGARGAYHRGEVKQGWKKGGRVRSGVVAGWSAAMGSTRVSEGRARRRASRLLSARFSLCSVTLSGGVE